MSFNRTDSKEPNVAIECDNCKGFLAQSEDGYYCTHDRSKAKDFYSSVFEDTMRGVTKEANWLYMNIFVAPNKLPCDCEWYIMYGNRVHDDDCQRNREGLYMLCSACKTRKGL
jgi:hypothetical protein